MKKVLFLTLTVIFVAVVIFAVYWFSFRERKNVPVSDGRRMPDELTATGIPADKKEKMKIFISYKKDEDGTAFPYIQIRKNNTVLYETGGCSIYFSMISHGEDGCKLKKIYIPSHLESDKDKIPGNKIVDIESLSCDADNSGNRHYLIISGWSMGATRDAGYSYTDIFDISNNYLEKITAFSSIGEISTADFCGCRNGKREGLLWLNLHSEIFYGGSSGDATLSINAGFAPWGVSEINIPWQEKRFPPMTTDVTPEDRLFFELAIALACNGRLNELRQIAAKYNFTEERIAALTVDFYRRIANEPYARALLWYNHKEDKSIRNFRDDL